MLNKQVQQPNFVVLDLGESLQNLIGDEIRAAGLGREGKLLLKPSHGGVGGGLMGG